MRTKTSRSRFPLRAVLLVILFAGLACSSEIALPQLDPPEPPHSVEAPAKQPEPPPPTDPYLKQREQMVQRDIAGRDSSRTPVENKAVLDVMLKTLRHEFVPDNLVRKAYEDGPLPIGHGQTISQPYIVEYMTEMLKPTKDSVVLEIGTGSGYQAAILAQLVKQVYTIEIVAPLAESAAARLKRLGYDNVEVRTGDGYFGWPEHGPYDAIIVTAAASHIPPALVEQLKPGGRMAIPVGTPFQVQELLLVEKHVDGTVKQRSHMPVRFVPLTGKGG